MSVSSMSGKSKQNQKKTVQMLVKKTHFTEPEVEKLLDCHYKIMVAKLSPSFCVILIFFRNLTTSNPRWTEKSSDSFFMITST